MAAFEQHVLTSYTKAKLVNYGLPANVYREALMGYYRLSQSGQASASRQTLTVVDFERPSREKRLWVIDLKNQTVLFHTLVAHGKNTGADLARTFSNREGSEMSSLGFYTTGATYQGKHGLSLKLNGRDPGYNTNAYNRAVVVHGADYVSEQFVRQHGRLGRSQGCPALPVNQSAAIIQAIKGGTVLYVHGPNEVSYRSEWLQLDPALLAFAQQQGLTGS
ncbi:murein L,D-transpeptidase catalytic domain family protein [Hymenobacter tibetensis]|uniref:Murein L,D-transpeptidase catalytic domain family protein n=1 Tax=Hymenobacter tibetensis TaxID=497967 RepID=A0ABY4DAD7_9BACT|nr:murein L,D-transpeptidase catalytic domain family protein [Hymenobacter tibetensis]UOG77063.1 murein L,D-transpeptidase catalytic domain family protein [Hymenobacter tibetensis]